MAMIRTSDDHDDDNDGDQGRVGLRAESESIHTVEIEPGIWENINI